MGERGQETKREGRERKREEKAAKREESTGAEGEDSTKGIRERERESEIMTKI